VWLTRSASWAFLGAVAALALAGLPGLASFPARLLVLGGAWGSPLLPGVIGGLGVALAVVAAAALLWTYGRVFLGAATRPEVRRAGDLAPGEAAAIAPLLALVVALGLMPRLLLDLAGPALGAVFGGWLPGR